MILISLGGAQANVRTTGSAGVATTLFCDVAAPKGVPLPKAGRLHAGQRMHHPRNDDRIGGGEQAVLQGFR
jgi:hypothetical protein